MEQQIHTDMPFEVGPMKIEGVMEKKEEVRGGTIIATCLLCSLVSGVVGGAMGVYAAPYLQKTLGVSIWQGVGGSMSSTSTPSTPIVTTETDQHTIEMVKRVSPSVVSIVIKKDMTTLYRRTGTNITPFDSFFNFGFPQQYNFIPPAPDGSEDGTPREKQVVGGGSGFIVSEDGMILTNKHVISDEDAEYVVVTSDGVEHEVKILAQDQVNDLAIIKIEAQGLTPLELGDSSTIEIGQTVIAIGNTLGEYNNTVTRGVVSGINRVVQASDSRGSAEVIQEAIQTDAAINPGNSGGPLLNLSGHVIGINTAINSEGQAIGFALPVNTARKSIESVKKYGRIIRPYLGVRYVIMDATLAKQQGITYSYGALVQGSATSKESGVVAGGPAEKAGLAEGDLILEVQGQTLDNGHALPNEIAKYSPNDTVTLKVLSKGAVKEVKVVLGEFKD